MEISIRSVRPFIGALDFELSRAFYKEIGFSESVLDPGFSVFHSGAFSFYLQNAYVEDWINNTMVFLEVTDPEQTWKQMAALELHNTYKTVKLSPIRHFDWGKEFYLHDPSGILWHIGSFKSQ